MRTLCWWSIVGAATLALMGCSSSTPTAPVGQTLPESNGPLTYTQPGGYVMGNAGHFRMRVDLNTMTGDIIPVQDRHVSTIGDQYQLPINQFFASTGGGFALSTVGLTPAGDVQVGYTITHPFKPAADLSAPATAANREDLGVSGRVIFVTPAPSGQVADESSALNSGDYSFPFTSGAIIANTKVIKNADGYYDPAGMMDPADFPAQNGANAWPFKALVDESLDPRTDSATGAPISNLPGGDKGNYDPATGGWQRATIGAGNNGWTGYGVMHQGQTVSNSIVFDPDLAEGGTFNLDFLVVVKYIDPRGGASPTEKKANRLPSAAGDPTLFAYREPWGAQDLEQVTIDPLTLSGATAGNLNLKVVDLDYAATEDAGFPGTALDGIPTGTSGIASVEVASSNLFTSNVSGSGPTGTGTHADPVVYSISVANQTADTGGVDTAAYAMVKIVDPEDTFVPTAPLLSVVVDKNLAPVATPPHPIVYQAIKIDLTP